MKAEAMDPTHCLGSRRSLSSYSVNLKIWLLLFCTALIPVGSQAQTTAFPQWATRYAGPGPNYFAAPSAIAADSQGNTYVTGHVLIGTAFSPTQEMLTIKYDPDGHKLWQASVASPTGTAQGGDIAVDAAGNVYVLGGVALGGSYGNAKESEFATVKYDTNGVRQWIDFLPPPPGGDNSPYKLLLGPQDDVFVSGTAAAPNNSTAQVIIIKYDSAGRQQWTRQYPPPVYRVYSNPVGMGMDAQGNIYVANDSTHTTPMIYKFDVNGNLLKSFSTGEASGITSFHVDPQGNSYAAGCNPVAVITKSNSQGNLDWVHNLTPYSCVAGIQTDANGNVYISQTLRGTAGTFYDVSLLKLNANGVQQWQTQFHDGSSDHAGPLVINSVGDVYLTGGTGQGVGIFKYGPDGQQIWLQQNYFGYPAIGIVIGGDGGLFVEMNGAELIGPNTYSYGWLTVDYVQDVAKVAPSSLSFGNETVHTQSTAQSVQLTNTTSTSLTITGVTIDGDFHQTNNCPSTLAPELSCTINVTFTPSVSGSRTGTLTVSDPWEGSPRNVALTGTGAP
jgi:Abnormal spindle-like microcephaly-assoc'd, ASPM-SPD-2-Hydin